MKVCLSLAIVLLSLNVFAGPEERKEQQKCYVVDAASAPYNPTREFPTAICIENIQIDTSKKWISVQSYFTPEFFRGMKLEKLVPAGKGKSKFLATNNIFRNWDNSCGDGSELVLLVSGIVDKNGSVDPSALQVGITHTSTRDTCHSEPSDSFFRYKLQ